MSHVLCHVPINLCRSINGFLYFEHMIQWIGYEDSAISKCCEKSMIKYVYCIIYIIGTTLVKYGKQSRKLLEKWHMS